MASFLKAPRSGKLLGAVERHLAAKPAEFRDWKVLHPSAMSKYWCPRAAWFVVTSETAPPKEKVSRVGQSIFDEGHLIHHKYQTYFAEMGNLYGCWRCVECQWFSEFRLGVDECYVCGGHNTVRYAEVPLANTAWLVSGHADGWIKGLGDDVLIEIKSVGTGTVRYEAPDMFDRYDGVLDDIWKNLKRPFMSHIKQAQIYLSVLNATRNDAPQEIVFLYECKSNQQAKEFSVPFNQELVQPEIDKAILVKTHVDLGTPPECPEGGCRECKKYDDPA